MPGEHRAFSVCSAQRDLCSFLSGTPVRSTGVALAAHVLATIQTPRSGLLEPAHSNSPSPPQSRFSADTRCDAIRASPLAQNPSQTRRAQVPRWGTLLEPARTKSFSSNTREGAQEGLSSGPLAQTRHRQRDAGFAADLRCYAIRASPLAQTPSHTRWVQVPERDFARCSPGRWSLLIDLHGAHHAST